MVYSLYELHVQSMPFYKKLMHCTCKPCEEQSNVIANVASNEAPSEWKFQLNDITVFTGGPDLVCVTE